MMLTLLLFAGAAAILAFEGRMLVLFFVFPRIARPGRPSLPAEASAKAGGAPLQASGFSSAAMWALGFPVGAFLNALVFFLYTLLDIPLAFRFVLPAHAAMIALLFLLTRRLRADVPVQRDNTTGNVSVLQRCLVVVLSLSIAVKLFYGVTHAVVLPTYYYDSLSQWTMRARVSYEDKAIAFDADESRGISKPQYPILLHALQIFFMLPQGRWTDAVANGATLLLTLSGFLALFLLLKRMRGTMFATIAFWALIGIPLVPMHLAQGFGDIHVVEYVLLSAVFLWLSLCSGMNSAAVENGFSNRGLKPAANAFLLISAMFVTASAWVKLDGLVFGVLPWLLIVGMWHRTRIRVPALALALALALAIPWPLFLLAKGLPLSPHGAAFALEWHPGAVIPMLKALFASGSFGMYWYVVLGLGLGLGLGWRTWREYCLAIPIIVWGLVTFVGGLFVYLFTPNVVFLLNAQTFSRTMLIPLSLLLLGFLLTLQRGRELFH